MIIHAFSRMIRVFYPSLVFLITALALFSSAAPLSHSPPPELDGAYAWSTLSWMH